MTDVRGVDPCKIKTSICQVEETVWWKDLYLQNHFIQAPTSYPTCSSSSLAVLFPPSEKQRHQLSFHPSPCPLSGSATRWWHHHKSHLPSTRGQWYVWKLTPRIPVVRPTTPREPDAFSQAGWLSSMNSSFKCRHTAFRDQDLLQTHLPCDQLSWKAQERNICYDLVIVSWISFTGVQYEYFEVRSLAEMYVHCT